MLDIFMLTTNTKEKQDVLEIHYLSVTLVTFLLNQLVIFKYRKDISLIFVLLTM